MKGSHWFIIFIVAFLVIMFAVEYHLPKKFVWTPTFGHYDDQPFGCAVFDSLLSASLPNGYTLSKKTFYQLEEEDTLHSRGILAVAHDMALTDIGIRTIPSWRFQEIERYSQVCVEDAACVGETRTEREHKDGCEYR